MLVPSNDPVPVVADPRSETGGIHVQYTINISCRRGVGEVEFLERARRDASTVRVFDTESEDRSVARLSRLSGVTIVCPLLNLCHVAAWSEVVSQLLALRTNNWGYHFLPSCRFEPSEVDNPGQGQLDPARSQRRRLVDQGTRLKAS